MIIRILFPVPLGVSLTVTSCHDDGRYRPNPTTLDYFSIYITSGKVMALFKTGQPAERITAVKSDDGYWPIVSANVPLKGFYKFNKKKVELSNGEW